MLWESSLNVILMVLSQSLYYVMRMFSECDTNAIIIKYIPCYENVLWMWY